MKKDMTFEDAKQNIERIIQNMEEGNLPLEESISQFEEAAELVRYCQKKLDSYQKKIEAVTLETEDQNE